MDLLQSYDEDDDSESDETHPTTALTHAQTSVSTQTRSSKESNSAHALPKKRTIVTGTFEHIALTDQNFNQGQRVFDTSLATVPPIPKRPRPSAPSSLDNTTTANTVKAKQTVTPKSKQSKSHASAAKEPSLVPTTSFHLQSTHDYQNRPWHSPPADSRTFETMETYTPYIPNKRVWQTQAHTKSATVVRFSQPHGNILLTAGLDGLVKVFHVSSRKVARTYNGHSTGVRHAAFDSTAESFLSAGYDRRVLLWSTETGRVRASFRTRGVPISVAFTPSNDNEFLVACSDKRVLQLDMRDANRLVQSYDQHMGSVNSLSFIDQGKRFVSSSDDKVLRVWEYGVPVVIKYLTDPSMHSMPVTLLHPNQRSLACQSMDNTVRIYTARDKFKRNDKKIFKNHLVAGYACGLTFSPDGRFLGSGDSMGRLFFWDWKSTRMFRTLQAHNGVCIDLDWHPTLPSLVASCGWDGSLMLWD